jgi:N-acetylglucosaminyldiphosphoundecaprenol N-acetyl-beta-D-mannosaminyltransferase
MSEDQETIPVMGHELDVVTLDEAVQWVRERCIPDSVPETPYVVHTVNVDHFAIADSSDEFAEFMKSADLSLADGAPLCFFSRMAGHGELPRVTGQDLFVRLARHEGPPVRVFVLGAEPDVNATASQRLSAASYPGLAPVGGESPKRSDLMQVNYEDALIARINNSGADLLIVAFGAPTQELWLQRNAAQLDVKVAMGLGSALDVFAGKVQRAPGLMQKLGLEWLFRLVQEPRRLARRYLVNDSRVALHMAIWALRTRIARTRETVRVNN